MSSPVTSSSFGSLFPPCDHLRRLILTRAPQSLFPFLLVTIVQLRLLGLGFLYRRVLGSNGFLRYQQICIKVGLQPLLLLSQFIFNARKCSKKKKKKKTKESCVQTLSLASALYDLVLQMLLTLHAADKQYYPTFSQASTKKKVFKNTSRLYHNTCTHTHTCM